MTGTTTSLAITSFPVPFPILSPYITEHILWAFFFIGLVMWLFSFAITVYHWLRYLRSSPFFLLAITTYTGVSIAIILYAVSGIIS